MPGTKRVRDGSDLASALDPTFAARIGTAWASAVGKAVQLSITAGTESGYMSYAREFENWCADFKSEAFPVTQFRLAAFILFKAMSVKVDSLKTVLAGIKYFSQIRGHAWVLDGNFIVRRTMRFFLNFINSYPGRC